MLNIPEAVKQLYKEETTEQIRKNLRITFPDGQLSDEFPNGITCNNIVAESMRFTESVCSQDNFKFGTSEAPVIEFETVGVPNILGYRIQAWLEIETTTVSDDLTGDYDGEYVSKADSDLGFPFYRLPLGVFTVQSCPRSHGAMTHRQITAYGLQLTANDSSLDAFTRYKISQFYRSETYDVGYKFFCPSLFSSRYDSRYFTRSLIDSAIQSSSGFYEAYIQFHNSDDMSLHTLSLAAQGTRLLSSSYSGGSLIEVVRKGWSYSALAEKLSSNIKAAFIDAGLDSEADWSQSYMGETELGSLDAAVAAIANILFASNGALFRANIGAAGGRFQIEKEQIDDLFDMTLPTGAGAWDIVVPYYVPELDFLFEHPLYEMNVYVPASYVDGAEVGFYDVEPRQEYAIDTGTLKLPHTLTREDPSTLITYYSFYNSFSMAELFGGLFEMRGMFGKVTRAGALVPFELDNTAAETFTRDYLASLWWDESVVNPVGSVQITYKDKTTEQEATAIIQIGNGLSVYDMSANYYFQKWGRTLSEITALIQSQFAANVAALTWTPTDATAQGRPWLEAGDWIEAATGAEDVQTVGFPILRRELSGIQSLTDTITSVAGLIIEVANV